MKKLFFILLAFFSTAAFSQNSNDAIVVFSGGVMRTMNIKSKPKETKGSVYYSDSWRTGNIYLFSGEIIKNYPLKYDLKKQEIEIQVDDDIKVIAVGAVKKVEWFKSKLNKGHKIKIATDSKITQRALTTFFLPKFLAFMKII